MTKKERLQRALAGTGYTITKNTLGHFHAKSTVTGLQTNAFYSLAETLDFIENTLNVHNPQLDRKRQELYDLKLEIAEWEDRKREARNHA